MDNVYIERLVYDLLNNIDYSVDDLVSCPRSFIEGLATLIDNMNNRIKELEGLSTFGDVGDAEKTLYTILYGDKDE